MSDSSQPQDSSNYLTINDTSIEEILKNCTIDLGGTGASMNDVYISPVIYSSSNVTLTNSVGAQSTFTIGSSADTITIGAIGSDGQYSFNFPEEWRDAFPNWDRVQDMCKKYPGLKVAFDNFKVFYEMCKDDYDNPTPKK